MSDAVSGAVLAKLDRSVIRKEQHEWEGRASTGFAPLGRLRNRCPGPVCRATL